MAFKIEAMPLNTAMMPRPMAETMLASCASRRVREANLSRTGRDGTGWGSETSRSASVQPFHDRLFKGATHRTADDTHIGDE